MSEMERTQEFLRWAQCDICHGVNIYRIHRFTVDGHEHQCCPHCFTIASLTMDFLATVVGLEFEFKLLPPRGVLR